MLRAIVAIGALQLTTMVLLLVRTKVLALLLGPANLGLLAVLDKLVAVVAQTVSLSLPFAALRYLPPLWSADREAFGRLYAAMRNLLLGLAGVAALGGAWVGLRHPGWFGPEYHDVVGVPMALAFATLPVVMLVPFIQSAIAARMRQNDAMAFTVAHAAVSTLAAVAGVWVAGIEGLYATYAVAGVLFVAAVLWRLRTHRGGTLVALRLPRPVWRFSSTMMVLAFAVPYGALYLHYRVLRLHGAETAGWMQAALGLALAVRTCMGAAQSVFLTPNVNRDAAPEERMRWVDAFQRSLALLLTVLVPPLLLFPDLAVRLLYSSAFVPAAGFVAIFVAGEVVTMLSGTYQSLILANDRLRFHIGQNLAAQLLVVGLGAALVPRLGIGGAALAALSAPLFLYATTTVFLRRGLGLGMSAEVHRLAAALAMVVVAAGIAGVALPGLAWGSVLAKAALYGAILVVAASRLTADERHQLRHAVAGLRARLRPAQAS